MELAIAFLIAYIPFWLWVTTEAIEENKRNNNELYKRMKKYDETNW